MLQTALQIGKALRNSPESLKYHRFVKPCPSDNKKKKIFRLCIPVLASGEFDIQNAHEIDDENLMKKLFYLTFKTSSSDSLVKYIFGDIYYFYSNGKEGGYYRLDNPDNKSKAFQCSSFERGVEDAKSMEEMYEGNTKKTFLSGISVFREEFQKRKNTIETILKYPGACWECLKNKESTLIELLQNEQHLKEMNAQYGFARLQNQNKKSGLEKKILEEEWSQIIEKPEYISHLNSIVGVEVFIHFDFSGKHWYELESDFAVINEKMLEDFRCFNDVHRGYVLSKSLYKTISSPEKDYQFPGFQPQNNYRTMLFSKKGNEDEILDLFYAIDYISQATLRPQGTDLKISVLPNGQNLQAKDYEKFRANKDIESREKDIELQNIVHDSLFDDFGDEEMIKNVVQFDFIFTREGKSSTPDVDLIEVSGLDKSFLLLIVKRIRQIKHQLIKKRNKELSSKKLTEDYLDIIDCFFKIFDGKRSKSTYEGHMVRVLPKIYSGTYYRDPLLLPKLIETAQYQIRNGQPFFNYLKYNFYLLMNIQNTQQQGENLMKIQNSPSYQMGILLGKMAQPLRSAINSFEKNYVGNLSRRLVTISDLVRLKTYIDEKLVIHNKAYPQIREASRSLTQQINSFVGTYNKDECAFGFFESYFTYNKQEKGENNE